MEEPGLKERVERLVGSGASDFDISKEFKAYLHAYLSSLDEYFSADAGREFLYGHTKQLDMFITEIYRYILRDSFGDFLPLINTIPITIIALGSYGRQQLCVYSDIDIMLLYKEVKGFNIRPLLERFLYLAWDAGLQIGQRVHEVSEIEDVAKTDITIKSALLESRFIYGSKFLWTEFENRLVGVRKTAQKEFIEQKLLEQEARHKKYRLSMEPNIKEGVGGLRDSNTLFWMATCLYGISSNKDLLGLLFSEAEYREYRLALEFLFKLRSALHLLAGKKEDTLMLQNQRDAAFKLGFKDTASQKAETALMNKTLKAMRAINLFCSINCTKLARKTSFERSGISFLMRERDSYGFYKIKDVLYVSFHKKPQSLQKVVYALLFELECGVKEFDYSVHNYLIACAQKQKIKITKELIVDLFSQEVYPLLSMLYETSLLSLFFPAFERISYLAQFDGYHKYPVDMHTLECIKYLESISDPSVQDVYGKLGSKHRTLVKLALFFHDIGKGSGKNHAKIGATIFGTFAKKLGFLPEEIALVKQIILHHTLMSSVAFREDLNSEKTIVMFAGTIKQQIALDMLYVLTYADLNGVDPKIYSSFNRILLKELYTRTSQKLRNKELVDEASARLAKESVLMKNEAFKALDTKLKKATLSIASDLFFLKFSPLKIVDIVSRINADEAVQFTISNEPYLSFEIISKQWINFGRLLAKFSFLDIASMDIFKLFGGAKYFKISFSSSVDDSEVSIVKERIEGFLASDKPVEYKKPSIEKRDISFDFSHSDTYAKMYLSAKNQQGLLAFVIEVFDELGIDIATAKVDTAKGVAKDMFLIEKSSGIQEKQREVIKRLIAKK